MIQPLMIVTVILNKDYSYTIANAPYYVGSEEFFLSNHIVSSVIIYPEGCEEKAFVWLSFAIRGKMNYNEFINTSVKVAQPPSLLP